MKKFVALALSLVLAGSLSIAAMAAADTAPVNTAPESSYSIVVDGNPVEGEPVVMVPLRPVAEALGFTVTWEDGRVVADTGDVHTTVVAGVDSYVLTTSHEGMVGMSAPFSLGVAPYRQDGVTYVPVELFAALLGNREDAVTVEGNEILISSGEASVAS